MTEENAITTLPSDLPLVVHTQEDFNAVASTADYLPRLAVVGSNTELFKEQKIKEIGTYLLQWDKNRFLQLKAQIDIMVYTWRPKALDMRDATPLSYFDRTTQAFKDVQALSGVQNSNCMAGPEFLIWIPDAKQIAVFFMGSKTARKEAPNLLTLMNPSGSVPPKYEPVAATLKVKFIKAPKFSWHGPEVLPCNTPIALQPDIDELVEEIQKFNNPPKSVVEKAPPEQPGGRER